jgi:hypothetical protein
VYGAAEDAEIVVVPPVPQKLGTEEVMVIAEGAV